METVTLTIVPVGPSDPGAFVRALEGVWPAHAPAPTIEIGENASDPLDIVLFTLDDPAHEGALIKLIDVLDDQRRTLVVLAPPERVERLARLGDGVVCLPSDLSMESIALSLSTLVQQRGATRSLLHEHDAFMRTHKGMAREMQHIREELQLAARVQREPFHVKPQASLQPCVAATSAQYSARSSDVPMAKGSCGSSPRAAGMQSTSLPAVTGSYPQKGQQPCMASVA